MCRGLLGLYVLGRGFSGTGSGFGSGFGSGAGGFIEHLELELTTYPFSQVKHYLLEQVTQLVKQSLQDLLIVSK